MLLLIFCLVVVWGKTMVSPIGALYMLFVYACMSVHFEVVVYKQMVHLRIMLNSHSWSSLKASKCGGVVHMHALTSLCELFSVCRMPDNVTLKLLFYIEESYFSILWYYHWIMKYTKCMACIGRDPRQIGAISTGTKMHVEMSNVVATLPSIFGMCG